MPCPSLRAVLVMFFLFVKLVSGQVQADVKTRSETSDSTKSDRQVSPQSPSVSASQDSRRDNWGLLPPGADPENRLFLPFAKHLAQDQKQFWTYPFHARRDDAKYVLPFLAFTGALVASDSWMSKQIPDSPSQLKRSFDFSNYALYSLVGGVGATYLWGHITGNDHLSETGLLGAEAAINSTAITYALKGLTQRPRQLDGNGTAGFFRGGSSFPSEHAAIAWSAASVLAHEYPGPLTKLLAYGLASGITISRVTAKQHFASDVVVGSVLGWYMGRQVYRARHDPELGGSGWGSNAPQPSASEGHSSGSRGSPSVPLDSWIYPAFERLAAWGYLQTEMLGQRPWTRSECARLLEEASALMPLDETAGGEAAKIYKSLQDELVPEQNRLNGGRNLSLRLDSLYTRITNISGPPVTDSYNFGKTIINDYGRPFQEGTNTYSGLSGYGTAGPFAFYVRAEYQHAPSAPAFSAEVRQAVADKENVPFAPASPFLEINRPRIVEGHVSLAFKGLQFSFGKQALWWGPTETGPLVWSTNAEPITMLRVSSPESFKLPSIFHWLGPARTEFFIGQLQGHQYIVDTNGIVGPTSFKPQPFIHGQKLSFKPTPNLEFGFSRTVIFAGLGHPFTFGTFWRSFSSIGDAANGALDVKNDQGDRRSGFDVSYRLPHLRKWATFYVDSFCDDDVLPLAAPQRCAWSPGLYLPQFPRLSKLDLRAEGVYTAAPGLPSGTNYQNVIYRSGYTNDGSILGNWVGRAGRGVQLSSTYWLSPRSKIQAAYRHQGVDRDFLQGGWLDDMSLRSDLMLQRDLTFSGTLQYERWNFPLLSTTTKSDLAVSMSLTFRPKWGLRIK